MTSEFIYTTYIKTAPQKLWDALTNPEFIKQYWFGAQVDSGWKPGSPWTLRFAEGEGRPGITVFTQNAIERDHDGLPGIVRDIPAGSQYGTGTSAEVPTETATATVLKGDPRSVNDPGAAQLLGPQTADLAIAPAFDYEAPASSFTVIRIPVH